jgi:hypothetical protein
MPTLPDQYPMYLIIDAFDDKCHNSPGILSPREYALLLLKELVDLGPSNLYICVTCRPDINK